MSHFWNEWPSCYMCDKQAYRRRVSDNSLVCRDHENTFPEHPEDCLFCVSGEPMIHNYEPSEDDNA